MEERLRFGPSIDLALPGNETAPLSAAQFTALLRLPGEFAAAARAGRVYSLRLVKAVQPRQRAAPRVQSAFVAGGIKVGCGF